MTRYETLFLSVPELTSDEFGAIEASLDKTIKEEKGVMISCERWGKYKLAYPVKKQEYGIYGLIRFETEEDNKKKLVDAIKSLFVLKYNDTIMRFVVSKLDVNDSLAYHRPESLEEAPGRGAGDGFLKDNRIKGYYAAKKDDYKKRSPEVTPEQVPEVVVKEEVSAVQESPEVVDELKVEQG